MLINILILILIVLIAIFFAWLTRRAWKARSPILKWIGALLGGLLTLLAAFIAVLTAVGMFKFYGPQNPPIPDLKVDGTPEQIARGQHLASAFCVDCHSTNQDFPMTGGVDMGQELPVPLGQFYSVNLTPAGPLKDWSDGQIFRAIRYNVDKDGHPLSFMAKTNVRYLADEDIVAVIAFLRSQEPVEHVTPLPPDRPSLLGFILAGLNFPPAPPTVKGVITAPPKASTQEYGKFMTTFLDCTACHGPDLSGGTSPVTPKGPSLRVVKDWTVDQFIATLRTGKTPDGHELSGAMPWRSTGHLDDVELGALYSYLVSLP